METFFKMFFVAKQIWLWIVELRQTIIYSFGNPALLKGAHILTKNFYILFRLDFIIYLISNYGMLKASIENKVRSTQTLVEIYNMP